MSDGRAATRIGAGPCMQRHQTQAHALLRHGMRLVFIIVTAGWSMGVAAQPGFFDTTWRAEGRIVVAASNSDFVPGAVAVVNGRTLVAGVCNSATPIETQGCAFRLDAAGNIDPSYGDPAALNNIVRSERAGLPAITFLFRTFLSAIDDAGRVHWLRQDDASTRVGRLNASGTGADVAPQTLDLVVAPAFEVYLSIQAHAGRLYLGGYTIRSTGGAVAKPMVARLGSDLRPDLGFGNGLAVVLQNFGDSVDATTIDLAVRPDAGVCALIRVVPGSSLPFAFWVACFGTDGRELPGFGVNGRTLVPITGAQDMHIAIDDLGRVVLAGSYQVSAGSTDSDIYVARVNTNGAFDPAFGDQGVRRFSVDQVPAGADVALDVIVQPDHKPLIAGKARASTSQQTASDVFFLARLNANGFFDAGFGAGGLSVGRFTSATNDVSNAATVQALDETGKLYLAGTHDDFDAQTSLAGVARIVTGLRLDRLFRDQFE